ncbi:hypothetical protein [Alloprevotella tannerae]
MLPEVASFSFAFAAEPQHHHAAKPDKKNLPDRKQSGRQPSKSKI